MYPYAIGLDIGISSVGWAALALDGRDAPCGIISMGSRIFDAAEQPKTGASLAAPRREARSARRRTRRRRHRNERIRFLLTDSGLLSQEELEHLFEGKLTDIYALRVEALDRPITRPELARVLIHISQRRGFRSNRKGSAGGEDGELLKAVSENQKRMTDNAYRTVAEMLLRDVRFAESKRNKGGVYITTVSRDMTEDEVHKIFTAQRSFGTEFASEEFEAAYLAILLSQRSFDDGPGGNSPYGGSQIERMIGECTLEKGEKRAARASYSFEYFNLLQKINHVRLISGGQSIPLSDAQRSKLRELAHTTENLTYARIRKELQIGDELTFNAITNPNDGDMAEAEKKEKFCYLKAYHQIRKAIERNGKGRFAFITHDQLDTIGYVLSVYKTSANIRPALAEAGLEECDIDVLEDLSFAKFGHLSVKACRKIIPYLEQGMNYNDACAAAGYDFKAHSGDDKRALLPPLGADQNEITSPVVLRAISQTVKVINAIIRKQGSSPTYINIELAREMSRDFYERKKLYKDMKTNQARNARILDTIQTEYGKNNATGLDLVKYKLWEEQDGRCLYSGKPIPIERLFEPNFAEVDHIVPYSISFDDSYRNKALVLAAENRNKGNRLPMQYLTEARRDEFVVRVNTSVRDYRKRRLLLKEQIDDEGGFKERNLQDTKTISRFMLNYIRDNLEFTPFVTDRKKHVTAVNGAVTSYMRKRWGITKIREDGDLHHAIDAVVIACTTDAMIQQLSRYSSYRECRYTMTDLGSIATDPDTGEVIKEFPYPWPMFRKELEARLCKDPARVISDLKIPFYMESGEKLPEPLFVSRMPRRKVTGAAHKDTVKSAKRIDEGYVITKRPLASLKLDKDGEIADYFDPSSDTLLYEALKARLIAFGGNGEKAFAEPFHKPKSDGTPGPLVKKVKLKETTTLNVPVHGDTAVADNDSMVRVDVFRVENDGYYFVPIYVADTLKPELPDRACVAHKPYDEWAKMDDENFVFSLYPNDLIKITHRSALKLTKVFKESNLPESYETKSELMYYRGANISTGSISCINHDNTYIIQGIGIKTLPLIEKYTVDVLGEYHKVKKETRQRFDMKRG